MHFWKLQYIDGLPKNANVKHSNEIRSSKFMYIKYYFNRSINQFKEYTNDGFDNEEFLLIKNINKDIFSCLVNPNGIVRIGDSIYQFKRNFTKSILASVPGKINKLINGNLNSNNGVVFSNPKSFFSISGTTNCDYPSYFYNNEWAETRSIDFSSNPKYKLVLKGYYSITSDYYCNALYNPSVKVTAESYRKRWFEVQWFEVPNYKSIEASYTVNHPSGLVSNEYSLTGTSALWQFKYSKSFPQINSQTYSTMFNVSSFYAKATMSGGSSGAGISFTH